mgnify:CR=1
MISFLATALIAAAGNPAHQQHPSCAITKEFVGTAPSDIVQQEFEEHFQQPLTRVDCRDNGLCYQKWGKNCTSATQ